jgi:hypothetical protein
MLKRFLFFGIFFWGFASLRAAEKEETAIRMQEELARQSRALERLLEGLKDSETLTAEEKKTILNLLKSWRERDVQVDIEMVIEELLERNSESAKVVSRDILTFLRRLKQEMEPEGSSFFVNLEEVLKDQKDISKALQKLKKQISEKNSGERRKEENENQETSTSKNKNGLTKQQKKTIEHLVEKQQTISKKLKNLSKTSQTNSQEKKGIENQVEQMSKLIDDIEKGELDSALWESESLEKKLEELIKKMNFDLNPYAFDQNQIKMSRFIEFLRDIDNRQRNLHDLWRMAGNEKETAIGTVKEQEKIMADFSTRDLPLQQAHSLSYRYGFQKIKETLKTFLLQLKREKLPGKKEQKRLEGKLENLIDGLKKLKGRLEKKKTPEKRESHQGQDVVMPEVTLMEELRYLRLLQKDLHERFHDSPEDRSWAREQKELLEILFQIKKRLSELEKKS